MGRFKISFNQDNCIGCKACQVACKDKNNLSLGTYIRVVLEQEKLTKSPPQKQAADGGQKLAVTFFSYAYPFQDPSEDFPTAKMNLIPCNSCGDLRKCGKQPACVDACITNCLKVKEEFI